MRNLVHDMADDFSTFIEWYQSYSRFNNLKYELPCKNCK